MIFTSRLNNYVISVHDVMLNKKPVNRKRHIVLFPSKDAQHKGPDGSKATKGCEFYLLFLTLVANGALIALFSSCPPKLQS
jgi:hypothetical protein